MKNLVTDDLIDSIKSTIIVTDSKKSSYCIKLNDNKRSKIITIGKRSAFGSKSSASRSLTNLIDNCLSGASSKTRRIDEFRKMFPGKDINFITAVNINHYIEELSSNKGKDHLKFRRKAIAGIKKELISKKVFTIEPIK